MSEIKQEGVGFIKYSGELVPEGMIDAGAAGMTLTGLDEVLRFFNEKQAAGFARVEYEIPVRTEAGSWVAVVMAAGATAFGLGYLKKAGEKMAENDFRDIGMRDVLNKSFSALQWLVKLVKHTRMFKRWDAQRIVWRNNANEVGVPNHEGEYLYIPVEYFRWYTNLPASTVTKLVGPIRSGRTMSIGIGQVQGGEVITLDETEKRLFVEDYQDEEEEFLFPDMEHGSQVKLEGRLIRGNEAANSIGLEYEGHVLNCHPEHGNVRQYKLALFLRCVVEGYITRHTKHKFVADKRPTILISKIVPLESDEQYLLFN